MKLSQLLEELPDAYCAGGADREITSLCTDSRVAGDGELFFCIRGTRVDSHEFAKDAERRGAAAVVCERDLGLSCPQVLVRDGREAMARMSAAFYGHPERTMKVIGVTGTNGKTTVSHMIRSILVAAGVKAGVIGTLGARYADRSVAPVLTTPDPVSLFSLLSDMKKAGTEAVVCEVSAHALALNKECPLSYEAAVFTNLTHDHLDFFPDMDSYGRAKAKMFDPARCKYAVLNFDDKFGRRLSENGTPFCSFALDTPADAFALVESETLKETRMMLNLCDELCETTIRMTGRHNVSNALAAAMTARRFGAGTEEISKGLSALPGVDGRLEWAASFRGADVFVDFAHTPDGLEKSLSALRAHCAGRLVCLFGCGGNRDAGKRAPMGETVARLCDFAVITSDNPRYEDPCEIIAQVEQGFRRASNAYVCVQEREKATEYALNLLGEGDILLVAGKGGEYYQEIMGIKYSYNDKNVIKTAIEKLGE